MTWRKEMNARKPAEKRKRTLRQWGFLSIHVVLLFALWAAIVAVNINITSIEQFAGSVGGGGAGIVGQLVNAIPAALPALFGGILQTLAKKLSRLSKWDNPESQRIHELYATRLGPRALHPRSPTLLTSRSSSRYCRYGFFFGRIVTIGLSLFIYYQARFGSRPTHLIPPPIPDLSPRLPALHLFIYYQNITGAAFFPNTAIMMKPLSEVTGAGWKCQHDYFSYQALVLALTEFAVPKVSAAGMAGTRFLLLGKVATGRVSNTARLTHAQPHTTHRAPPVCRWRRSWRRRRGSSARSSRRSSPKRGGARSSSSRRTSST